MPQLIASVEGVEIKKVFLQKDRTTLGRRSDNDVVLDNLAVSGHHCAFDLMGLADVYVQDLGSTNGTYVNNRAVKERTRLADGDVLAIGQFRIRYLSASGQPSAFGQTAAMKLSAPVAGMSEPSPLSPLPVGNASFRVLTGTSAGLEVPVVKAVTTFGKPGVCVVAVSHRRNGYFVARLDGDIAPNLNGLVLGRDALALANDDVLELAGTKMLFVLVD